MSTPSSCCRSPKVKVQVTSHSLCLSWAERRCLPHSWTWLLSCWSLQLHASSVRWNMKDSLIHRASPHLHVVLHKVKLAGIHLREGEQGGKLPPQTIWLPIQRDQLHHHIIGRNIICLRHKTNIIKQFTLICMARQATPLLLLLPKHDFLDKTTGRVQNAFGEHPTPYPEYLSTSSKHSTIHILVIIVCVWYQLPWQPDSLFRIATDKMLMGQCRNDAITRLA